MSGLKFTDDSIQKIFGHEAAEDEDVSRLKEYYFKSDVYESITSDVPLRILVGHKGIGKSALFTVGLYEDIEDSRLSILVRPDDVTEIETHKQDFLKASRSWYKGLERIIAEKVLSLMNYSASDRPIIKGSLISFIKDIIHPVLEGKINMPSINRKLVESYIQKGCIRVYIDDLDRGWKADKDSISRLSALLNAIRDLARDHKGLQFKVALRSDVYFLVRTADESTDKIEGSVIWHKWSNHEILCMLVKRIESFFGRNKTEKQLLSLRQADLACMLEPVIVSKFQGYGHWKDCPTYRVLMSLIRKRPRDLVKLCSLAASKAKEDGRNKIETDDLDSIFAEYSQGRLQDTINEYKSELNEIERLLFGMRPNKIERSTSDEYLYTTDKLIQKINNILQQGEMRFYGGKIAKPNDLAKFMYKINFLTARKVRDDGHIDRKYFEENRYIGTGYSDFGYDWEVHPAYRWALQPDNPKDVYSSMSKIQEV